jgi:hypothetical protein
MTVHYFPDLILLASVVMAIWTLFQHENQPNPTPLSVAGCMRHGVKSDLLDCLPRQKTIVVEYPSVECVILDGVATVQMSKHGLHMTFSDYACGLFKLSKKFVMRQGHEMNWRHADHIEPYFYYALPVYIVVYVYKPNSLKSDMRST